MRIQRLARCDWQATADAMQAFTDARTADVPDELWLAEHPPVYTLGVAGRREHVRTPGEIPVRTSNRGGQVTFHGPGQVLAYPLVDLRRHGIYVKEFVYRLEAAVIGLLQEVGITGHRVAGAPGVYVRPDDPFSHAARRGPQSPADPFRGLAKVAALGIKVSRHCTYHGLALNVAMDLTAFERIDPCGYPGLQTLDLARLGASISCDEAAERLARRLCNQFIR